jgi:hypothetical protein
MRHRFIATHRNWSREEDEDIAMKLPVIFLELVDPHVEPLPSLEPRGAAPPSWATTAARRAVCCSRSAPPWSPLHFVIFPVTVGTPERPGHRAPVSCPPGNGTTGFPLSRCHRTHRSWPPPPVDGSTARIRSRVPLHLYEIHAADRWMDGHCLMKSRGPVDQSVVDLVYGPWTYSIDFSI